MASPHPRGLTVPIQNESQQCVEPDTLWGAEAIRIVLGLESKEQVFYLAKRKRLPGVKKIGNQLIGSRKILSNLVEHIAV
jgi:hypothetical protein